MHSQKAHRWNRSDKRVQSTIAKIGDKSRLKHVRYTKTAQILNQTFGANSKTNPAIGTSSENILFAITCLCITTKVDNNYKATLRHKQANAWIHTQVKIALRNSC